MENRNIATDELLSFFTFDHLPEHLKEVSFHCKALALEMVSQLTDSRELTTGLRKLLEAKDCFVRAKLIDQRNKS